MYKTGSCCISCYQGQNISMIQYLYYIIRLEMFLLKKNNIEINNSMFGSVGWDFFKIKQPLLVSGQWISPFWDKNLEGKCVKLFQTVRKWSFRDIIEGFFFFDQWAFSSLLPMKNKLRICHGHGVMVVRFSMQSVHFFTKVVSSIPTHIEVYSIQLFVIKFVIVLRKVGGFLQVLHFPPPIKLTAKILLKNC